MKKLYIILSLFFISQLGFSSTLQEGSGIYFEIGYMFSKVKGQFIQFDSNIKFDEKDLKSSFAKIEVSTGSVNMKCRMMETFVKKKSFFNSNEFPAMVFHLLSIEKDTKGYLAKGSLEIKGVKKIIEIPFEVFETENGEKLLKSTFEFDRTTFNIGNSMPMLKDKVVVKLNVPITNA